MTLGGSAWKGFNATAETIVLSQAELAAAGALAKLQQVVAQY